MKYWLKYGKYWLVQLLPAYGLGILAGYWKGEKVGLIVGCIISIPLFVQWHSALRRRDKIIHDIVHGDGVGGILQEFIDDNPARFGNRKD